MKRLWLVLLAVLFVVGCATPKLEKGVSVDARDMFPLVIKNMTCKDVEYAIGEWIDENNDGDFQMEEWTLYVSDRIATEERKELLLPAGMYIGEFLVISEEAERATAFWKLPALELEPNEKPVIFIECVHPEDGSPEYKRLRLTHE